MSEPTAQGRYIESSGVGSNRDELLFFFVCYAHIVRRVNTNGITPNRNGYLRDPDGTFVSFDDPNAAQLPLSEVNIGTTPRRINASGAVTGYYSDSNGARHAFVMQ